MDENWLDEKIRDKDGKDTGEYANFVPQWDNVHGWSLRSVKTGMSHHPYEFTDRENPEHIFKHIIFDLVETCDVYINKTVSPVFFMVWLKKIMMYDAMNYRETKRLQFLKDNPTKDLPQKEAVKIMKRSEKLYQDGYEEYFERFRSY